MAEKAMKKIPNRKKSGSGPGQLQTAVDGPTPSPMGPWGPNGIRAPRRPNLYQLQGDHLHITYSPVAFDGQPNLVYHDSHQTLSFSGKAVRTTSVEFGTLVSVTIGPDNGYRSTIFTLVAPTVTLTTMSHTPVKTFGITTIKEIGIGQTQVYTVTELSGAASIVEF